MRIERLNIERCMVGEGAIWNSDTDELMYIDIFGGKVIAFNPRDGARRNWDTQGHVGALALRRGGGAVLAMSDTVRTLDFDTGLIEPVTAALFDGETVTANDGTIDAEGRFLLGGCSKNLLAPRPDGGLYSVDRDGSVRQLDKGVHQSNSHCFSPDGKTLYCSDSFTHTMYAYDYVADTGDIQSKRVFINTQGLGGRPDGSAVDEDGLVWVSIFEGGKVAAFTPEGSLERIVEFPTRLISSLCFGGEGLSSLYVTTIDPKAFGWASQDDEGGHVYLVEGLGTKGIRENRFAG